MTRLQRRKPEKTKPVAQRVFLGHRETVCPPHDWEAGGSWGVIIGVSKCRRCGKLAERGDFAIMET